MEIEQARTLATQLINQHLSGWTLAFDNSRSRFGCCLYRLKEISLSRPLVILNTEEAVKDTILHEIAHGIAGINHGHDAEWKRVAKSIGCTGNRCFDHKAVKQPYKPWQAVCEVCGKEYKTYRRHTAKCACRICYKEHKDKAILTFKYVREENDIRK